ncbi:MAG: hypothetical protein GF353_06475 [Candidatus Lokiarchaeota archaeon]|nr:hypothetical protein [Candidatus Lokiarchaeota archaeon]
MNIWVLDMDSGVTLLYKNFMNLPVNEDLVSGLLTALNQFTVMEFKQGIESIDMGGLRWVYIPDKDSNLLFIAAGGKDTKAEMLRAQLNVIKQAFRQEYIEKNGEWRKNWNGNIEMFKPFKKKIEEFHSHWIAAETITTIAEFFDILGIFQQILNLLVNVIEDHLSSESKSNIYDRIDKMFHRFSNLKMVKEHPELSKITFSRDSGFNIISINPNNCDFMLVEKQIISLISSVVEIIKEEIGHLSSLDYFVKTNIFEYIFNNLNLLKELHLEQFLLQLFLTKQSN